MNVKFVLYTLNDYSDFWKMPSFGSKKNGPIKKLQISKVENLLNSNFDLNHSCKIVLTQTIKFGVLTQLNRLIFLLTTGEKLWGCQKWSLKETGSSHGQKYVCSDNCGKIFGKR